MVAKRGKTVQRLDSEEPEPMFSGCGQTPPVLYRGRTIYTSVPKRCWRIKMAPGDRHDKAVPFGKDPESAWSKVLDLCKK